MATLVRDGVSMTETAPQDIPTGDPRVAYAQITSKMTELLDQIGSDDLANATPCPEFSVKELAEHIVMVQRRVAAMGNGESFTTIDAESVDAGWADDFRTASHQVMTAWTDGAKLGHMFTVPWGEVIGAELIGTYTGELAVHAWDLATALDAELTINDELLDPIVEGAKALPAEGREHPDVPFGPVVDPGADAPALLRLAGWMGRQVQG